MDKYEQKAITLRGAFTGGSATVSAYVAPCGLAYHQSCYESHNGPDWTVTHVASGRICGHYAGHFETPGQCRTYIERISALHDWTSPDPPNEETRAEVDGIAVDCQCVEITLI